MSQLYRFVANSVNSIDFANRANIGIKLAISHSSTSVGDGANKAPVLRNTFTLRTPMTLNLSPDCAGSCDRANATRVVEVRTSAPLASKAEILADLEELTRIIALSDTDYGVFEGFLPPVDATFGAA